MSSFRTAIEYAEDAARYQRSLCDKRKLNRADEKEKEYYLVPNLSEINIRGEKKISEKISVYTELYHGDNLNILNLQRSQIL